MNTSTLEYTGEDIERHHRNVQKFIAVSREILSMPAALTDAEILFVRDDNHIFSLAIDQDCIAFARSILSAQEVK